jgi:hypothetical protein
MYMKIGYTHKQKGIKKMRKVQAQGTYTSKKSNTEVSYDFEYAVLESISDIASDEVLKLANRMLKVDGNNTAREKAKSANGDSTAKVLTPEQKEANKQERKGLATLKAKAKAKGMSIEDLMELIG